MIGAACGFVFGLFAGMAVQYARVLYWRRLFLATRRELLWWVETCQRQRRIARTGTTKVLAWLNGIRLNALALGLPALAALLGCAAAEPTIRLLVWGVLLAAGETPGPYTAWAPRP